MSDKFETLLATHCEAIRSLTDEEFSETDKTLEALTRDALLQAKCLGAGDERENAALLCAASAKHWRDQDVLHDKANFRAFAYEAEHRRDQIRSGERAVGFADAPEVPPGEWTPELVEAFNAVETGNLKPDAEVRSYTKEVIKDRAQQLAWWMSGTASNAIHGDNIGHIRRFLFLTFDHKWNGLVRDVTAELEIGTPETAEAFNDFHAAALKPDAEVRGDTPVPTLYCWCGHDLSEHYEDQGCLAAHCYCSSFEERPKDDAPKPSTAPPGNASDTAKVIWEGQTAPPSDETPYISTKVQRPPVAVWIEIPDEFGISSKRIQMAAHQWFDEWGGLMFDGDPDHYSHWRLADQPKADEPVDEMLWCGCGWVGTSAQQHKCFSPPLSVKAFFEWWDDDTAATGERNRALHAFTSGWSAAFEEVVRLIPYPPNTNVPVGTWTMEDMQKSCADHRHALWVIAEDLGVSDYPEIDIEGTLRAIRIRISEKKNEQVEAEMFRVRACKQRDSVIEQRDELRAQLAQANAEKVAAMGEADKWRETAKRHGEHLRQIGSLAMKW